MSEVDLTREELLDVALLDVIADGTVLEEAAVCRETQEWCADPDAWAADAWPLLSDPPTLDELERRLDWLARRGMVRRTQGIVEITRAGFQMWDGFPWEHFAEDWED